MTTQIGQPKRYELKIEGLSVSDSRRSLKFVVRKTDIGQARSKDPVACAVARACLRLSGVSAVKVHVARTYVKMNGRWKRFTTPLKIRREIISFDKRGSFEAGQYELLPAHIIPKKPRRTFSQRREKSEGHKSHAVRGIRTKMSGSTNYERVLR